jgi:hypothetical protein
MAFPAADDAVAPEVVVVAVELDELDPLQAATARLQTSPSHPT